jgi:hypothetical protein
MFIGFLSVSEYPGIIEPPYTMSDGRLCRAKAMMTPGMFLSHPGMAMQASWCWAHVTVSMLSAMTSRV